ncbi:MAG: hypothetical protein WEA54_00490 [Actinomycetota bacterium]
MPKKFIRLVEPKNDILTSFALHKIVVQVPVEGVAGRIANNGIVASLSIQVVDSILPMHDVGSCPAANDVGTAVAKDLVVPAGSIDVIVTPRPMYLLPVVIALYDVIATVKDAVAMS